MPDKICYSGWYKTDLLTQIKQQAVDWFGEATTLGEGEKKWCVIEVLKKHNIDYETLTPAEWQTCVKSLGE